MSTNIQRIYKFRTAIIAWLEFYSLPELQTKSDNELIEELIVRATSTREYVYGQNNAFERFLQIPVTLQNGDHNVNNWNTIADTYLEMMKRTLERLGKEWEDPLGLPYIQQWNELFN